MNHEPRPSPVAVAVAAPAAPRPRPAWWPRAGWLPRIALLVVALALMARTPNFLTARTGLTVLDQASVIGVLALGQAFVLIGGGFDLSQGAMVALTAGAAAWLVHDPIVLGPWALGSWRLGPWSFGPVGGGVAAPLTLALGLALGALNGVFVAVVRTNPFVTTLSTSLMYRGAAFVLLGGLSIPGVTALAALDRGLEVGGGTLRMRVVVFLALAVVCGWALRRTVAGRHLYATGGNPEAARLAGLRTTRLRIATFALSGAAAALGALMHLSRVRVAKPDTATGYELDAIAACIVGGISLQGGSGGIAGAVGGVLLLQALALLITVSNIADEYRTIITGGVILIFAATDALTSRRARR